MIDFTSLYHFHADEKISIILLYLARKSSSRSTWNISIILTIKTRLMLRYTCLEMLSSLKLIILTSDTRRAPPANTKCSPFAQRNQAKCACSI